MNSFALDLQTTFPPLESLAELTEFIQKITEQNITWNEIGILIDDGPESIILFLINEKELKVAFRITLATGEHLEGLKLISPDLNNIEFRAIQGYQITLDDLISLDALQDLWSKSQGESQLLTEEKLKELIERLESPILQKGRGKDFSAYTTNAVLFASHGRCMFEGCAINVNRDDITGAAGNFSYLAHNIAASEQGPRGVLFLSGEQADSPDNVLLLCDKHHRLVDKIATPDYPAHRLSQMRANYINSANKLLNSLSFHPVVVYSVLWPVQKARISAPSPLQINQSMNKLDWRMHGEPNSLSDNESLLRKLQTEAVWKILIEEINDVAEKILQQTHSLNYRAALFVFGLMPAVIALGAKLGNKNELYPMLRYRDGGQWTWPLDTPREEQVYDVVGLDSLSEAEGEIIVTLAFTGDPEQFKKFYQENSKMKVIEIIAHQNIMGNGAIGHPKDGVLFMSDMQKLMLKLKSEHGVNKIHLLPCASNAVCMFFGKAFDNYHPDIWVYDFDGESMGPKLNISNENGQCKIATI
ncbi:SAVED domain-containing protein [Wohlfahrtiimonas chitiniclastica]|uniref:SAVED domain-containing protein n=1 Tax=Wohlfahrtiimonas chitiniclastica TaxID=400946 RepID=A0AB35BZC8_9GAMM|nr:SAVED domain-containing protein [Wohlfahrtiimonas chitiniclastica]MBS7825019.1 SAVED domain-containing protein [Wohlfahrtiimonas chitiniclastica]MBS7840624.1 SAVED domain-containing protein [Wohlfahrtiimonas chitiniclastica]